MAPFSEDRVFPRDTEALIRSIYTLGTTAAGGAEGMISVRHALLALRRSGMITAETALSIVGQGRG